MESFLETKIREIREQVGSEKVLLGLSGGVGSRCAASRARGARQLTCIYVDHGLMRQGETEEIRSVFEDKALDFRCVDAADRFLAKLEGVTDPEQKRKIIGREFALVFEDEAKKLGKVGFLAQGTIYPDVVESGTGSAVIKSHHNVGGLPKDLGFSGVVEPLRYLFKDEVRKLGLLLGLPESLVNRQPFPGPGLSVRVLGEITREKLAILRPADAIVREEIGKCGCRADQYFAVLTGVKSVGVMGDGRTYDYTVAVRCVETSDFMTCVSAPLPGCCGASPRITNEVRGINRVVYDITCRPRPSNGSDRFAVNAWKRLDERFSAGKGRTLWQFVKFNLVSLTVTILQLLLANLLPLAFDRVVSPLPPLLRAEHQPTRFSRTAWKYVVNGVVTWDMCRSCWQTVLQTSTAILST